jgi:hypothetical protein
MPRWREPVLNWLADGLKLAVRACLLIDAIVIAAFSVWFVSKGVLKLAHWLDTWLFVGP